MHSEELRRVVRRADTDKTRLDVVAFGLRAALAPVTGDGPGRYGPV